MEKIILKNRPDTWQELQNAVGQLFSECGFAVEVSKVIETVRSKKEIDVYAEDHSGEYKQIVLIECKHWNTAVKQETVHAFHNIMNDFGANLGFVVSKSGFQAGCYDAIQNTNILLVTLEELEEKYYQRWQESMIKKHSFLSDTLFPYWDPSGGRMPRGGKLFSYQNVQLVGEAYKPFLHVDPKYMQPKGKPMFNYPLHLPSINDDIEQIGGKYLHNDRDVFDFMEGNKENVLRHYQIVYGEKL